MTPLTSSPPRYSPSGSSFRFRGLASLAGRLPVGGPREAVLATYLAARLAHDCLPPIALPLAVRRTRAAAARVWLGTIALPSAVRPSLVRLAESTAGDANDVAVALNAVIFATATHLDAAARLELERLAAALAK